MDQNLFHHGFSWLPEYDPLAVCWALAGPTDDDDEDDEEEDSYSRGGDSDDDEDEDVLDEDDEEEDEAGTLWARRQVRQRP